MAHAGDATNTITTSNPNLVFVTVILLPAAAAVERQCQVPADGASATDGALAPSSSIRASPSRRRPGSPAQSPFAPQPDDVVVKEHWGSSSFANTDLDVLLRQRGITHRVVIGLLANTCVEVTSRYAVELGYHVTLMKDATAAYSDDRMHAAHELNGPTYAHAILTTAELLAALG